MDFIQNDRLLRIYGGPFVDGKFFLTGISGHEAISRLYSYQLDFISTDLELDAAKIIGKPVKIEIAANTKDGSTRYINGFISRLSAGDTGEIKDKGGNTDYREYRAEVVPWLWFLTQTARCFVYFPEKETKNIKDIIKAVLERAKAEYGLDVADFDPNGIEALDRTVEHCVQYRETDFNFVSRIMEQYGIYYYFTQQDGEHKMVLGMDTNYPPANPQKILFPEQSSAGGNTEDVITSWEHAYEFVSGKWTHQDYNFQTPLEDIKGHSTKVTAQHALADKFEVYDYPGEYSDKGEGQTEARVRQEEEEVPHDSVHASSRCRMLMPGQSFTLLKRQKSKSLDSEAGSYLVTSMHQHANQPAPHTGNTGGSTYSNSFSCVPSSIQYRPARITPKPVVSGIQTAVVVGKQGQEIETDQYGRIKICFHWDRENYYPEQSNHDKINNGELFFCWVRVAQNMAGKGWGFMAIPRIGQEVVVDFIEGDPDRPLVVGSVYNEDQMPAYDLDEHKTRTYIKTNSSPGGKGFNELCFEDKANEERIFIHAEKNFDQRVKNNSTEHVGGNMHLIVGRDEADEGGEVKIDIENKLMRHVGPDGIHFTNEGDEMRQTDGSQHLTVAGDWNASASTISEEAEMNILSKAGISYAMEAGTSFHIKAGADICIEAGAILSLKVGGSCVVISPAGVTIKGPMVVLDGGLTNINSGPGTPAGTCTSCSPTPPTAPEKAEPNQAHREKSGQKSSR